MVFWPSESRSDLAMCGPFVHAQCQHHVIGALSIADLPCGILPAAGSPKAKFHRVKECGLRNSHLVFDVHSTVIFNPKSEIRNRQALDQRDGAMSNFLF